jgi:hypothetical protein
LLKGWKRDLGNEEWRGEVKERNMRERRGAVKEDSREGEEEGEGEGERR